VVLLTEIGLAAASVRMRAHDDELGRGLLR
jgi:hypothetical protein